MIEDGMPLTVVVALALMAGVAIGSVISNPRCYEDEVYAVQIDHNPKHGLTWRCESTDHFIERNRAK